MFPSILRLNDGRLLLTYTVRSIHEPLGVRAAIGIETDDGFEFNTDQDIIIIDGKTPTGQSSGGGFGNTIQLDDKSFLDYEPGQFVQLSIFGLGEAPISISFGM